MTLSFEPHWGFADETSGVPIRHFGWEGDLLFDRALVPGFLFGAMNLHIDTDRAETVGRRRGGAAAHARPVRRPGGRRRCRACGSAARHDTFGPTRVPAWRPSPGRRSISARRSTRSSAKECGFPPHSTSRHGGERPSTAGRARSRQLRALPGQFSSGLRVLTAARRRGCCSQTSSRTRPSSTSLWASVISSWTRCMDAAAASPVPSWVTV